MGNQIRRNGTLIRMAGIGCLLVASTVVAAPAEAAAPCSFVYNFHNGRLFDPPRPHTWEPQGTTARIQRTAPPALCYSGGNPWSESNSWVMLNGYTSNHGYAQIGFLWTNYSSNNSRMFIEWSSFLDCPTCREVILFDNPNPTTGNTYQFTVSRFANDGGHIHFILDGVDQGVETPWDPIDLWGHTQSQWMDETFHDGDDVFGTTANRQDWSNVHTKNEAGQWNPHSGILSFSFFCFYNVNPLSSSSFKTWTDPIDHNSNHC